jgi:hypothetical protein
VIPVKRKEVLYARHIHYVLLEGDEKDLPNRILITMADRGYKPVTLEPGEHPGHFGGEVKKLRGRKDSGNVYAEITVYTD